MPNHSIFRLRGGTELGEGDSLVSLEKSASGALKLTVTNEFFQTHLSPFTLATLFTWNGSSWVSKPLKVWNGSSWVSKPLKIWSGSAWVTAT